MDPTIDYYNLNAENYIENTQNVDMHQAQDRFLRLLKVPDVLANPLVLKSLANE